VRTLPQIAATLCGLLALALSLGCSSSTPQTQAERLRQQAEGANADTERPPFEMRDLKTRPADERGRIVYYKPGHWFSASVVSESNQADFRGQLETAPVMAQDMPYRIGFSQPIELAKGEEKSSEMTLFVPPRSWQPPSQGGPTEFPLALRLARSDASSAVASIDVPAVALDPDQYFFVVLAAEPSPYQYLEQMPSFRKVDSTSSALAALSEYDRHYHLVLPRAGEDVTIPAHPLAWTASAYLLWDDFDADKLSIEQRRSIVTWLHWGGQLIVSGPETLTRLRTSFLAPYLPAESTGTRTFSRDDLRTLVDGGWLTETTLQKLTQPIDGETIAPRENTRTLLTASDGTPLVVDGQVGRGRVVVSAFRLDDPIMPVWMAEDDSFLNSVILGRPPRNWVADTNQLVVRSITAQPRLTEDIERAVNGQPTLPRYQEARTRFLTREFGALVALPEFLQPQYDSYTMPSGYPTSRQASSAPVSSSWDDYSTLAQEARESLHEMALNVPDRQFVVNVLGIYFLILIPLNWLLFRLIGRVEWAWFAAPIVTIVYTGVVVYLTGVSLGFSRVKTEIAILEVQPGYEQAHVSRYTSLYTSLATSFDVTWDDPTAVALPFPTARPQREWSAVTDVDLHRDAAGLHLRSLQVSSNSEQRVHSEQFYDIGGFVRLETIPAGSEQDASQGATQRLVNGSQLRLRRAELVHYSGNYTLGDIEPGASISLTEDLRHSESMARYYADPGSELSVEHQNRNRLVGLWIQARMMSPGEPLLLAWNDDPLPGVTVSPGVAHEHQSNLILVHLGFNEAADPMPDVTRRAAAIEQLGPAAFVDPNADPFADPNNLLPNLPEATP
jgi:hypothetical protein